MDFDIEWWMTNLTSGLSIPIPKAIVATTAYKNSKGLTFKAQTKIFIFF